MIAMGLVLGFVSLEPIAQAKVTGRISGEVFDTDGIPIEGAVITFTSHEMGAKFQVTTDEKGKFHHAGLRHGSYSTLVEAEGFFPYEGQAQATAGDRTYYKVELVRKPVIPPEVLAMQRGNEAFASGDMEAAATAFEEAVAAKPDEYTAWFNLGVVRHRQRRYDKAAQAFQRAAELNPDSADALRLLGNAYIELGQSEKALRTLERYAKLQTDDVEGLLDLGVLYFNSDLIDKALETFERAAELGRDDPKVDFMLANAYVKASRFDESAEHLERFLEANPNHAKAHYLMGQSRVNLEEFDRALEHFKRFLELAPDDDQAGVVRTLVADLEKFQASRKQ